MINRQWLDGPCVKCLEDKLIRCMDARTAPHTKTGYNHLVKKEIGCEPFIRWSNSGRLKEVRA